MLEDLHSLLCVLFFFFLRNDYNIDFKMNAIFDFHDAFWIICVDKTNVLFFPCLL